MVMLIEQTMDERIVEMYTKEKKSILRISMELGIPERKISKIVDPYKKTTNFDTISDEKIIQLHKEKKTQQEMAEVFGVSRRTVFRKLKSLGLTRNQRPIDVPTPNHALLERMYVIRRMSIKEIANHFNTSKTLVQKWLDEYEIERSLSPYTLEDKIALYKRYVELNIGRGMPSFEELYCFYVKRAWLAEEMAYEYGVKISTVRYWLLRNGIDRNTKADVVDNFPFAPSKYILEVSYKEYAELVGIKHHSLRKYMAAAKKELIRRGELVDE